MKAKVVIEPSIRIKNSLGIIRGKNDRLDAARIARYLIKNLQELKLWVPRRKIIDELSSLPPLRERMVKVGVIITTPLNEDINFIDPAISAANINLCNPSIIQIEDLITNIDLKIKALYTNNDHCNRLMKIMLSVMGIGEVTALQILILPMNSKQLQLLGHLHLIVVWHRLSTTLGQVLKKGESFSPSK